MSAPDEIDALLYDFGGVLVKIDFDCIIERWAELAGISFDMAKSRFSHGEAYQRHERGEIGIAEYYESLRREIGIDLTDEEFTDGWQRVFGAEHPETVGARELGMKTVHVRSPDDVARAVAPWLD